jgi:hypothetical protein
VPHGCGKEQEGELAHGGANGGSSSLRSAQRAIFIAGRLPTPTTKGRAALTPQHGADLGRRAEQGVGRRTAGQYVAAVRRDSRSKATARRGLTTRASREWEVRHHARRGNGARSARCRTPGSSPALWRRSRARPCCFPAGQRDFDCVFLQKVELCDKNSRYESCR